MERDGYITKEAQNGIKYFDETFFVASNDDVNSTLAMVGEGTLDGSKGGLCYNRKTMSKRLIDGTTDKMLKNKWLLVFVVEE